MHQSLQILCQLFEISRKLLSLEKFEIHQHCKYLWQDAMTTLDSDHNYQHSLVQSATYLISRACNQMTTIFNIFGNFDEIRDTT